MKIGLGSRRGRRGIAGIVAAVFLFAMLFTVGTSYFLFVNQENMSYQEVAVNASNTAQSAVKENIAITTLLLVDGDLGFYLNNTGGVPVNVTQIYVVSPTSGSVLECAGVGFPSGSGCTNTSPSLWRVVNPGKGTPEVDTEFLYSAGTGTVTLKVLTHRGGVFTANYPPVLPTYAQEAMSAGALTVNLASFKWDQLTDTSNIIQDRYQSYCSGSGDNCALSFNNQVTAGDLLVFTLGWTGMSPPSTPTDSFSGDAYTLALAYSYSLPVLPTSTNAQEVSCSNTKTCSVNFGSHHVVAGDIIVLAIDWYTTSTAPTIADSYSGNTYAVPSGGSLSETISSTTYYSYIYYTTDCSTCSSTDTITATFGSNTNIFESAYDITGVKTTGLSATTGYSTSNVGSSSVTSSSYTPPFNAFVIGNVISSYNSQRYSAGTGTVTYTLAGGAGTCNGIYACSEYGMGTGSSNQVPMTFNNNAGFVETAIYFQPNTQNYYTYVWYTTAAQSGSNTITAAFSQSPTATVSIFEAYGYSATGLVTETNQGATGGQSVSVSPFTPGANSLVIGVGVTDTSDTWSAGSGSGYSLTGGSGSCQSVTGCSEYQTGVSSSTTVPMTLGTSAAWVEGVAAFPASFTPSGGIAVGGYPPLGVPPDTSIVFQVQFTNLDSEGRAVTLWPQSVVTLMSVANHYYGAQFTPFYIISGLSGFGTSISAYSTSSMVTINYKTSTTIWFGTSSPLSSNTQDVNTYQNTPFTAEFALVGEYSDGSLYSATIIFPAGIITQASIQTSPVLGTTGTTVSVSCGGNGCNFNDNSPGFVGWLNSQDQMTIVATFSTTSQGNVPNNLTFQVPSASAGYYTIMVSDYVNNAFYIFQHT